MDFDFDSLIAEIDDFDGIDFTPCDQETPWSWESFD